MRNYHILPRSKPLAISKSEGHWSFWQHLPNLQDQSLEKLSRDTSVEIYSLCWQCSSSLQHRRKCRIEINEATYSQWPNPLVVRYMLFFQSPTLLILEIHSHYECWQDINPIAERMESCLAVVDWSEGTNCVHRQKWFIIKLEVLQNWMVIKCYTQAYGSAIRFKAAYWLHQYVEWYIYSWRYCNKKCIDRCITVQRLWNFLAIKFLIN